MKLPNININIEANSEINDLIAMVSKFYPVEFRVSNTKYPGYQDLLHITTLKINQLITGELPDSCNQLIKGVEEAFSQFEIMPEIEKQFPNYAITIELLRSDLKEVTIIYRLKLRMSLLTRFFTVFHEETIVHKNASSQHSYFLPVITHVLSSSSLLADSEKKHFSLLIKTVEEIFRDYSYISHYSLFKTKIKRATPHGFDPDASVEYPLYNFLFDTDYFGIPSPYIAP